MRLESQQGSETIDGRRIEQYSTINELGEEYQDRGFACG